MSIEQRLLGSVAAFIKAVESQSVDTFSHDFSVLFSDMEEARKRGGLSPEDRTLGAEVSTAIEIIAASLDDLELASAAKVAAMRVEVESILATEDDCSISCSQPHTHSASNVPFQRSPTPTSPPTALVPLHRSTNSNDSGSDNDSDSEDLPTYKKKTGPENPATFRHLRDWFLQNLAHPFPSSTEKKALAAARKLPLNSINLWFTNMRRRSGWTACQTKFASSDPQLMQALINKYTDPETRESLPADVREEINRIQGYIDERGQERIRDFMIQVIQEGLEAGKNIPEDEWDDEDHERDGEDDEEHEEHRVYTEGWDEVGRRVAPKRKASEEEDEEDDCHDILEPGRDSKRGRLLRGEGESFPSSIQTESVRKLSNDSTATTASLPYSDSPTTPLSSFDGHHSTDQDIPPVEVEESPYLYPVATQQLQQLSQTSRPIATLRRRTSHSRGSVTAEPGFSNVLRYQQQPHGRSSSSSSSLRIVSGGSTSTSASMGYTPEDQDYGHHKSSPARRDDEYAYDRRDEQPTYYIGPPPPPLHPRHASSSSYDSLHHQSQSQTYYTSSSSSPTYSTPSHSHSRPYASQHQPHAYSSHHPSSAPPDSYYHPSDRYHPSHPSFYEAPLPSISRRAVTQPQHPSPHPRLSQSRSNSYSHPTAPAPEGFSDSHASFGDLTSSRPERRAPAAPKQHGSGQSSPRGSVANEGARAEFMAKKERLRAEREELEKEAREMGFDDGEA